MERMQKGLSSMDAREEMEREEMEQVYWNMLASEEEEEEFSGAASEDERWEDAVDVHCLERHSLRAKAYQKRRLAYVGGARG